MKYWAYAVFGSPMGKSISRWKAAFASLPVVIFRPYLFSQAECRPCFRPACIKCDVSDDFGGLSAGDAVFLRFLKMEAQRAVGDALADERGNRHQTAVTKV